MVLNTLSDKTLMEKVKSGDLDKLGLLFERYHHMLFQFFYNMNHNRTLSEDLVQNVFLRILKYRTKYRGDGDFKSWLFYIARNVQIDQFKKQKRQSSEQVEDWAERLKEEHHHGQDMIKDEELHLLQQAIEQLNPEQREVLVLSKLQGIQYREIARLLNCTEGNVKVKVFRAMQELKRVYHRLETQ